MSAWELRAGATKLREAANNATTGPWRDRLWSDYGEPGRPVVTGGVDCYIVTQQALEPDRTYIALANPVFGLAVADWLDATASTEASYFDDHAALTVARAILGGGE